MSLTTMAKTLAGEIPNVSEILARNKINEALGKVYDETSWSFQEQTSGWLCPGLVSSRGTATVQQYSPYVIGDAAATASWAAIQSGTPLLTQLQYRDPSYALYDIIAYNTTANPPFATLTLDRPWMEPTKGPGQPFFIYQAYFVAPVQDFRAFIEMRDTIDNAEVDTWSLSREDLAAIDPQRTQFGPMVPEYVIPIGQDTRVGSATLGFPRFELWPHVLATMPFSFSYDRRGPQLVNPGDEPPYPLTDELLTWRSKEVLYQFKEAQKGEEVQRGSGANWMLLAEGAHKEYLDVLKKIRAIDGNLHRKFTTRKRTWMENDGYSTNVLGALNIGRGNF